MSGRLRIAAALLTAAALACGGPGPPSGPGPDTPVPNTSRPPIDVRYGLPVEDVELAILLAVANPPAPPTLDSGTEISAAVLAAVVGNATRPGGSGAPWYFDGRQPGLVFAGYQEGSVRMRVAIRYDDDIVLLRIIESHNLGQTDETIHAQAFTRLEGLDRRIRRRVLAVAQRNRYGTPIAGSH